MIKSFKFFAEQWKPFVSIYIWTKKKNMSIMVRQHAHWHISSYGEHSAHTASDAAKRMNQAKQPSAATTLFYTVLLGSRNIISGLDNRNNSQK